jgi:hypothetical protein
LTEINFVGWGQPNSTLLFARITRWGGADFRLASRLETIVARRVMADVAAFHLMWRSQADMIERIKPIDADSVVHLIWLRDNVETYRRALQIAALYVVNKRKRGPISDAITLEMQTMKEWTDRFDFGICPDVAVNVMADTEISGEHLHLVRSLQHLYDPANRNPWWLEVVCHPYWVDMGWMA